jgi:hypothetical protein
MQGGSNNRVLDIDHVMFPIYNNNKFLNEVASEYSKNKEYKYSIGPQEHSYKGIYLYSKNFYVEHLSTVKSEYYWSNSLAIILDKKYWSYYKNPVIINDNFMTPKFGCGYFFVNPEYKFTNKKKLKSSYDNFTIYISKKLKKELTKIAGLKWLLPYYLKSNSKLCQPYDIIVKDNNKIIGPLFQTNSQEI